MEIVINKAKSWTIENFSDKYGLVMEVNERTDPSNESGRWYASFQKCEVRKGSGLVSTVGNGSTPEKAIKQYAIKIQFQQLVINAYGGDAFLRKEITVPKLN